MADLGAAEPAAGAGTAAAGAGTTGAGTTGAGDFGSSLRATVREALFSGLPILAVLTFVAITIKVFRVAHMETSTTVAIVSSADPVALLKGVIVTLLPGFLAGMIALVIWQWVGSIPSGSLTKAHRRKALYGAWAGLVAALFIIGFFTVPSITYLIISVPVLAFLGMLLSGLLLDWCQSRQDRLRVISVLVGACAVLVLLIFAFTTGAPFAYWLICLPVLAFVGMLVSGLFGDWYIKGFELARSILIFVSSAVAVGSILYLAISPDVWLPMRDIELTNGQILVGTTIKISHRVGAFVLDSNSTEVTLLLNQPRAVVTVMPSMIMPNPVICIGPLSKRRPFLLRPSQVLKLESDYKSPYETCPRRD